MLFHWKPKNAFSLSLRIARWTYKWTWKHPPLMLCSAELNTFSMTNTIYGDLVCRSNEGIHRFRGGDRVAI